MRTLLLFLRYRRVFASIRTHEGWRRKPYLDTTGHWTVGWGRRTDDLLPTCKWKEAVWVLHRLSDIERAIRQLEEWSALKTNVSAREACLEMCYQLGVAGYKKFINTRSLIQRCQFIDAGKEAQKSLWFRQTPKRVRAFQRAMRKAQRLKNGSLPGTQPVSGT